MTLNTARKIETAFDAVTIIILLPFALVIQLFERLKAAEKRLNELRQEQIDKANQEIEEIKRRSHEKMMQSFVAVPGVPPVFL